MIRQPLLLVLLACCASQLLTGTHGLYDMYGDEMCMDMIEKPYKCYSVFMAEKSLVEAKRACTGLGLELAQIDNRDEHSFESEYVDQDSQYWVGRAGDVKTDVMFDESWWFSKSAMWDCLMEEYGEYSIQPDQYAQICIKNRPFVCSRIVR